MKARNLTDLFVRNSKEVGEHPDLGQRGLRLVVNKTGRKSWVVRFRHPVSKVSRKLTLQHGLSLADARKAAADALHLLSRGIDPIEQKRAKVEAAAAAAEGTVQAVCTRYMELQGRKLRSASQYEAVFKRSVYPRLGSKQVIELKRTEIVAALDHVERTSGPSAADMALAVLRSALHWHERRSDTFRSPIISGMKRVKASERARTRKLSDDEVKAVWVACGDQRVGTYGKAVRFLILTGARRSEAAGLRRSEIETIRDDGDQFTCWRLPARRSKNKREVVRPLSRAALAIINDQPVIGGDDATTALVFTNNGRSPLALNSPKKPLLDEISNTSGWTIHDARRTFRSLLSRLRVPLEVGERLIGHSRPLLDKTYDQHSHLPAMQEAVDKLAAEVERIVEGGKGKVIRLRSS
jgi:integrase